MNKLTKRIKSKKRYGLLGNNISHSISPAIHQSIMKQCNIKGTYALFDTTKEEFDKRFTELNKYLNGYNITIPYKEKIYKKLTNIDLKAKMFGAVNTVSNKVGYNTDIDGFKSYNINFSNKTVLLLGAGGVARVMAYEALSKSAKKLVICARNIKKANILKSFLEDSFKNANIITCESIDRTLKYEIILNATPVGMWPNCNEMPIQTEVVDNCEYVFDSIYNPLATKLVLYARSKGIKADGGLKMLLSQALAAQKIWNPNSDFSKFDADITFAKVRKKLLKEYPIKIVFTGFMASGKSTIGKKLSKEIGLGFVDLDVKIVEEAKMTIPKIFKTKGEEYFRQLESKCLERIMRQKENLVVSTGGGALLNKKNIEIVKSNNGFVIYLKIDIETVLKRIGNKNSRPLLKDKAIDEINELYQSRLSKYEAISDYTENATLNPKAIINELKMALGVCEIKE